VPKTVNNFGNLCVDAVGMEASLATPTCRCSDKKKKKGNIVAIQMRHMAETVAITWKSGRACPQEELSSLHEAWEAVKVPRMNAAAFLAFCSVFSYFVL